MSLVLVVVLDIVLVVFDDSHFVSIELEGDGLPVFNESRVGVDRCLRYSVYGELPHFLVLENGPCAGCCIDACCMPVLDERA